MAIQEEILNDAVDSMTPHLVSFSLHTEDPGDTGDNELTGGDYSRVEGEWSPASGALSGVTEDLVYLVSAGNVITHVGMWDSDDVWAASAKLSNPQSFVNDGELTVKTLTLRIVNI